MEIFGYSVADEILGAVVPNVVYWLYGGLCTLMLGSLKNYRLHSKEDEEKKNLASFGTVMRGVLLSQTIQMSFFLTIFSITGSDIDAANRKDSLFTVVRHLIVTTLVQDTLNYFLHRWFHLNQFMYRHVHSRHHQLIVSYPLGSQYTHPVEAFLMDTVSGAFAVYISGMSPRTSILFFSLANMKTINDHCGLVLPWNFINIIFKNNTVYHDAHHQLYGLKYNFSTPFLSHWDTIMATYMPSTLEKIEGGGFKARPLKSFKDN